MCGPLLLPRNPFVPLADLTNNGSVYALKSDIIVNISWAVGPGTVNGLKNFSFMGLKSSIRRFLGGEREFQV
jgi:hypothetical protein